MPLEKLVATFSINPRNFLGLPVPEIKEGEKANLTLFSIAEKTVFDGSFYKTKGYNKAENGKSLLGRVVETVK